MTINWAPTFGYFLLNQLQTSLVLLPLSELLDLFKLIGLYLNSELIEKVLKFLLFNYFLEVSDDFGTGLIFNLKQVNLVRDFIVDVYDLVLNPSPA